MRVRYTRCRNPRKEIPFTRQLDMLLLKLYTQNILVRPRPVCKQQKRTL